MSARRYRYTGKERDEETGLYYHGARYYAPWLGRWTAADPSGLVDGVNLYGYVRGDPVALSDLDGMQSRNPLDFEAKGVTITPLGEGGPAPTTPSPAMPAHAAFSSNSALERTNSSYGHDDFDESFLSADWGLQTVSPGPVRRTLLLGDSPTVPGVQPTAARLSAAERRGYRTPWEAARAALEKYNPVSIDSRDTSDRRSVGFELGGLIYEHNDRYYFTRAEVGDTSRLGQPGGVGLDPWKTLNQIPTASQSRVVGDYHTHGGGNALFPDIGEVFSGQEFTGQVATSNGETTVMLRHPMLIGVGGGAAGDIASINHDLEARSANILNPDTYTSFLATPQGRFLLYIPSRDYTFTFAPNARLLSKRTQK